jgi:uncharacterized membrane protein YphA (DoxX/SURF4 family)
LNALRRTLALVAGLIFIATGAFKLFGRLGPEVPIGPAGFARVLAVIGIPSPLMFAYGVSLLELVGGLALLLGVGIRLVAALLALDMTVAFLSIGLPALLGRPLLLEGHRLGVEPWRAPLELGLWLAMGFLAMKG